MTTNVDGFLWLLRTEPTLLPPAPEPFEGADIDRRRLDEVHPCLRCGKQANCAFVADTKMGNRWLDLCHSCVYWLRKGATPEPLY